MTYRAFFIVVGALIALLVVVIMLRINDTRTLSKSGSTEVLTSQGSLSMQDSIIIYTKHTNGGLTKVELEAISKLAKNNSQIFIYIK